MLGMEGRAAGPWEGLNLLPVQRLRVLPAEGSVPAQPRCGWDAPPNHAELGSCVWLMPLSSPHAHRAAPSLLPGCWDSSSHRKSFLGLQGQHMK